MTERVTDPADPTLESLRQRLTDFAAARSWEPFHTPKNLAAALTVEAGELLEIFQWLTPEQAAAVMSDPDSAHRVRDEVADVLAYLLQFCTAVGVDPLPALAAKIERNELRFPAPGAGRGEGPAAGRVEGPAAGQEAGRGQGAGAGPGRGAASDVKRDVGE